MSEIESITKLPKALSQDLKRIAASEDVSELRKDFVRSLSVTVEQIIRMAALVRRLDELGDDLSDLEISLLPKIRKVAYGQVIPELLVRLQGRPSLLNRAAGLPLPDQRRIAEGEPLRVMEMGGDHRMIPPLKLTATEISQLFRADSIRDDAEQMSWLRERRATQQSRGDPAPEIYVDKKRGGLVVGERFIAASDLAHYLSQLTASTKRRR